jgi:diadenosine tetraphosphate (Ap4A) HIT family hydrolase
MLVGLVDGFPVFRNHSESRQLLVASREHAPSVNDDLLARVFRACLKLPGRLGLKLQKVAVNQGRLQHVPHLHFHVVFDRDVPDVVRVTR